MTAAFNRCLIGALIAAAPCLASAQSSDTKARPAVADGAKAAAAQPVPKATTSRAANGVVNPGKTAATEKRSTDAAGKAQAAPLGAHDEAGCHAKDSDA